MNGRRAMIVAAAAGGAGLVLTGAGALFDRRAALFSYLLAFAYWAGIAVAALIWLGAFHATRARWVVVLRRVLEVMGSAVVVLALLFVPLALGLRDLYVWAAPPASLGEHALRLLAHKRPWLEPTAFVSRSALYFALWIAVAWLLERWSRRQDETGALELTVKQRRLGAGALPLLGLTITFAAIDWLLTLNPLWSSTIFGVYYFAGSFLAAMAALTLIALSIELPGARVTSAHHHALGKYLLAFTAFWAYIAFSQGMLVWIADLPEETPWYLLRSRNGWWVVGAILIAGHFVLPFAALLSRDLKLRPRALGAVAAWLLLMHYLDLYWVVMPVASPGAVTAHWTQLTAFVGVGGVAAAFVIRRLRSGAAIPLRDPYLADSLRYTSP